MSDAKPPVRLPTSEAPLLETTWTNWPAVVVFTAGSAVASAAALSPTWSEVVGLGFPVNVVLAVLWAVVAALNMSRTLLIFNDRIVIRSWLGPSRELGRDHWRCLQVADPITISWWQRMWSGCGARPMVMAVPGSPCRSLFAGVAMTGIPFPPGLADKVVELLRADPELD